MSRTARLVFLVLSVWAVAAGLAWTLNMPDDHLVGSRRTAAPGVGSEASAPFDVTAARAALEQTAIWGVQRDGKPFPPPAPKEAERKIEWRLLAAVVRGKERYVVVRVDQAGLNSLAEGAKLPDGSKILKINPREVTVLTPEGKKQGIFLHAE